MSAERILAIPMWFDAERGHEVRNRGRALKGALTWYRSAVHSGASRLKLRRTCGPQREMEAIYVYDQVCQMVAAQPAARRGKLFDRFGRPMTVEDLAWELRREPAWTQEVIDVLLMAGWLRWMDPLRRLPGAWTGRQLGAAGAVSGADGAPTGRRRRHFGRKRRHGTRT